MNILKQLFKKKDKPDWEEFKKGNIAISCSNKHKMLDFLDKCKKHDIYWITGESTTSNIIYIYDRVCYIYDTKREGLVYGDSKEKLVKIFEWAIN